MSGSVSPLPWTGNKGCIYTTIDAFMPPHRTYVEACMGSAEVFLRKKPVEKEIINDYNGDLVRFFRVLQRNENLERLIGRLFLSFNSEQIFRANKALLAEVPNILDDLTETSVIIENTQWNDFDLAVAFYEGTGGTHVYPDRPGQTRYLPPGQNPKADPERMLALAGLHRRTIQ